MCEDSRISPQSNGQKHSQLTKGHSNTSSPVVHVHAKALLGRIEGAPLTLLLLRDDGFQDLVDGEEAHLASGFHVLLPIPHRHLSDVGGAQRRPLPHRSPDASSSVASVRASLPSHTSDSLLGWLCLRHPAKVGKGTRTRVRGSCRCCGSNLPCPEPT